MKLAPRSYLTIWHAIHKLASLSLRFIGESKATANGKHTCMSPLWNFRAFPPYHTPTGKTHPFSLLSRSSGFGLRSAVGQQTSVKLHKSRDGL